MGSGTDHPPRPLLAGEEGNNHLEESLRNLTVSLRQQSEELQFRYRPLQSCTQENHPAGPDAVSGEQAGAAETAAKTTGGENAGDGQVQAGNAEERARVRENQGTTESSVELRGRKLHIDMK